MAKETKKLSKEIRTNPRANYGKREVTREEFEALKERVRILEEKILKPK